MQITDGENNCNNSNNSNNNNYIHSNFPSDKEKLKIFLKANEHSLIKNKLKLQKFKNLQKDLFTPSSTQTNQTLHTCNNSSGVHLNLSKHFNTSTNKSLNHLSFADKDVKSSTNNTKTLQLQTLSSFRATSPFFTKCKITKRAITAKRKFTKKLNNVTVNPFANVISRETKEELFKKKLLKGKLFATQKNYFIMNKDTYQISNNIFHENIEELRQIQENEHSIKVRSKNFAEIITKKKGECFGKIKPTFRYEDYYMSPEEFINNNFTEEEIRMFNKDRQYFKLNKPPFNEVTTFNRSNLKDIILFEDNDYDDKIEETGYISKIKKFTNLNYYQQQYITQKMANNDNFKPSLTFYKQRKRFKPKIPSTVIQINKLNYGYLVGKNKRIDFEWINKKYDEKIKEYTERKNETLEKDNDNYVYIRKKKELKNQERINNTKKKIEEDVFINQRKNVIKDIYLQKGN